MSQLSFEEKVNRLYTEELIDGQTYGPEFDYSRLKGQMLGVFKVMSGGGWHTLRELADWTGGSEASVSARLRDLRKAKYGLHVIERRRITGGLWEYRMVTS